MGDTVTFIFNPCDEEAKYGHNITMTMQSNADGGMHISEFHNMCIQFAKVVGYCDKNIEEYFGISNWPLDAMPEVD